MKKFILAMALLVSAFVNLPANSQAATETDKEKVFLDTYKKAFEAKDAAGLEALLYKKGADPDILEFYTMSMTADMSGTITSIQLVNLSPEDKKKAEETRPLPNGQQAKLLLTPVKKLVIKIANKDANGTSTSSSESFVGESDGKLVISIPGPVGETKTDKKTTK